MDRKPKGKQGIILTILLLIFFLPMAMAWVMYAKKETWGTVNKGDLVNPPFSFNRLYLTLEKNGLAPLPKKWLILLLYPESCDKECEKNLLVLRQIWLATGKNMDRVDRGIITVKENNSDSALSILLSTQFAGTTHYLITRESLENRLKHYVRYSYASQPGTFFIVDPLGNIILTYKTGTDPNGILKDMERLLSISQIG